MDKTFVIDRSSLEESKRPTNGYDDREHLASAADLNPALEPDLNVSRLIHDVFLRSPETRLNPVVFAGLESGVGCSRTAAIAAMLLAQTAGTVCLIEANQAAPSLAESFGIGEGRGLADALNSSGRARAFAHQVGKSRLWALPAGTRRPASSLSLQQEEFAEVATELNQEFDFVVIDSPPLSSYGALSIATLASGLVLVLEAGKTRRDAAVAAVGSLRSLGIPVMAAVLNNRTLPVPRNIWALI
jgi:Mrp family chromosome partitioning ATPase